jgi:hypothetical protein
MNHFDPNIGGRVASCLYGYLKKGMRLFTSLNHRSSLQGRLSHRDSYGMRWVSFSYMVYDPKVFLPATYTLLGYLSACWLTRAIGVNWEIFPQEII